MANTATQDRARRTKKKYRKLRRNQTGRGIAGNLTKLGRSMGPKAINSVLGKKNNRQRSKKNSKSLQIGHIKN